MNTLVKTYKPKLNDVRSALVKVRKVTEQTPLQKNQYYSTKYGANIQFKREDLQQVRSYKIRGAYNKISSLSVLEKEKGVVCASAGNHAQGVALSCLKLQIKGSIFMPMTTPRQKIEQVEFFGKDWVTIYLVGDTFDNAQYAAKEYCDEHNFIFIPPFDDEKVIEGQATIALEILEQSKEQIDYLFVPVGGGGLAAGLSSVFKILSPSTKIIGVEPKGAASMQIALEKGFPYYKEEIDPFVDGASVKRVGDLTFDICKDHLDEMHSVEEGAVCSTILELYNKSAIISEPAGALSISILEKYKNQIKNKKIICILSGGNNDISRTEEIKEKSLLYEGLKHYFIVRFPQRSGALKEFVMKVLGPKDDITYFEYNKKNSRARGSAVIGIEIKNKIDFDPLVDRMKQFHFYDQYLNNNEYLLNFLV